MKESHENSLGMLKNSWLSSVTTGINNIFLFFCPTGSAGTCLSRTVGKSSRKKCGISLLAWRARRHHAPAVLGEFLTQHPTAPGVGVALVPTSLKGIALFFDVLRRCLLNGFRCKAPRQTKRRQTLKPCCQRFSTSKCVS